MKVTTQLTSKPLKALGLLCTLAMTVSALMFVAGESQVLAAKVFFFSLIGSFVVRALTWWNHA